MGKEYTNAPIYLTGGSPAGFLCDSVEMNANANASDSGAGELYGQAIGVTQFLPTMVATTRDLEAALDNIGLAGQCVGSGKTITLVSLNVRDLENCNTGALSNLAYQSNTGLLRLGSLSASRGEDATISMLYDALSDGTNEPVALASGVVLPSVTPRRYSLKSVTIDGTAIDEVDSVSIDFNVGTTTKRPALGSIWAESIGVATIRPVVTIRSRELEQITDAILTAGGEEVVHASTSIEFVERNAPSGFIAGATTTHVSMTVFGVLAPQTILSAQGGSEATHEFQLIAGDDGTNAPIVISTGVAV